SLITGRKRTSSGGNSAVISRRLQVTTEPFNDELTDELKTASKIHTGPIKLTSGADTCAVFTEKLQFTHKIPMYPSTHPEGYAYVVPA
ncbi:hypothetical protein E4U40_000326, partial [Claviceps sp. LM458 group G5]